MATLAKDSLRTSMWTQENISQHKSARLIFVACHFNKADIGVSKSIRPGTMSFTSISRARLLTYAGRPSNNQALHPDTLPINYNYFPDTMLADWHMLLHPKNRQKCASTSPSPIFIIHCNMPHGKWLWIIYHTALMHKHKVTAI